MINKTFSAELEKGGDKGDWTYVIWPEAAEYFGTRGVVKIKAKVDGVEFQSAFMSMGSGKPLMLPIKADIRKIIGKESGKTVTVELLERIEK
jgi:hypothetical protein